MSYTIQEYPLAEPLQQFYRHDNRSSQEPKLDELTDTTHPGQKDLYTLVKNNKHLSILISWIGGPNNEYCCEQYDFPLKVLSWFPWALEEFRKPPAEGGLHAGAMISKDMDVDGEMLAVGSSTDGYYIINWSRNVHDGIDSEDYEPMKLYLEWDFLYKQGFLELWKELSKKYERGELDYLIGDL